MHTQHVRVISPNVSEARRRSGRERARGEGTADKYTPREEEREIKGERASHRGEGSEEEENGRRGEREDRGSLISWLPIASDTFPRSTIDSARTPISLAGPPDVVYFSGLPRAHYHLARAS